MIYKLLLSPFSFLFYIASFIYHKFYNSSLSHPYKPKVKSICVGNLSVGGTGKTPMVIWLVDHLLSSNNLLLLSRGYGRKTKGFIEVNEKMSYSHVGDEPLIYKKLWGSRINVAVSEKRKHAIEKMLNLFPKINCVLLDDAFQHRSLKAGLSILLTTYSNPFFSDLPMPSGSLREPVSGAFRSDIIVVTKCPQNITDKEKQEITFSLSKYNKPVFFSSIRYSNLINIYDNKSDLIKNVLLVTGIANPEPLLVHLKSNYNVTHLKFSDHYCFTNRDIKEIHQKFDNFASNNKVILTTEKDLIRLIKYESSSLMKKFPWYKIAISLKFNNEKSLLKLIDNYVRKN